MKNTKFHKLLIFFQLICLDLVGQNAIDRNNCIQLDGFFYEYVPYNLTLPNSKGFTDLKIESSNLKWERLNNDTSKMSISFYIQPSLYGYLFIYDTILNKGIHLKMHSKPLPVSVKYVVGNRSYISGSSVKKEDLMSDGFFMCNVINFGGDIRYIIHTFDLTYLSNDKWCKYTSESSSLTNDQKNVLKNIKGKTIIVFDNMIIEGHNEERIKIEPFILYVN